MFKFFLLGLGRPTPELNEEAVDLLYICPPTVNVSVNLQNFSTFCKYRLLF